MKGKQPKIETPNETEIKIIFNENKASQRNIMAKQDTRLVEIESISDSSSTDEHKMVKGVIV